MHMTSMINSSMKRLEKGKGGTFSLMYIDIDSFNMFVQLHGMRGSDMALKKCNMVIKRSIRTKDKLSRWEGDVFIILFPQIVNEDLNAIAKKIRDTIEKIPFESDHRLTASIALLEVTISETLSSVLSALKIRIKEAKKCKKGTIIDIDGKIL